MKRLAGLAQPRRVGDRNSRRLFAQTYFQLLAEDRKLRLNNSPSDFVIEFLVAMNELIAEPDDSCVLGNLVKNRLISLPQLRQGLANNRELVIHARSEQFIAQEIV